MERERKKEEEEEERSIVLKETPVNEL